MIDLDQLERRARYTDDFAKEATEAILALVVELRAARRVVEAIGAEYYHDGNRDPNWLAQSVNDAMAAYHEAVRGEE